jgi:shikimate kinase
MTVILNINGPINAGKSTVSKLLEQQLENALFIEVDNLMSDAEEKKLGITMHKGWRERLKRLDKIIEQRKTENFSYIIFAYPMDEENYRRWCKFADLNTVFLNITLAPKLEVCLQNRGTRSLTEWEQSRIKAMYEANFHAPLHSDLIIDNSRQTPQQTVAEIKAFLSERTRDENS